MPSKVSLLPLLLIAAGLLGGRPVQAQHTLQQVHVEYGASLDNLPPNAVARFSPDLESQWARTIAKNLGLDAAEVRFAGIRKAPPPATICLLRADETPHEGVYLRMPAGRAERASSGLQTQSMAATFSVTYDTEFNNDASAKAAFQRAVDTWSDLLTSTQTTHVQANWDTLPTGVLGSAGPTFLVGVSVDGVTHWYNEAMGEMLAEDELSAGADIVATFNKDFANWHMGVGAPGGSDYDFESVVLHELTHGIGMSTLANFDDGAGDAECDGVANKGCLKSGANVHIWDGFLEDNLGTQLTSLTDPSSTLGTALTNDTNLFFDGALASGQNSSTPAEVYAPSTFSGGSSIAHLGEAFNNTVNALMTYSIATGEAARTPGAVTCAAFRDMAGTGFVDQTSCNSLPLPVELVAFEAQREGRDVLLRWETASETNNAGFAVETRGAADAAFTELGFIDGAGTSAERQRYAYRVHDAATGRRVFRLRQVDFDGTFAYGPAVELTVEIATTHALSPVYPNPFNPQTTFSLAVGQAQQVRIEVLDLLGRTVATLHDGTLPAHESHTFAVDAASWPSGVYLVRAVGETFTATRQAVLVK